MHACGHDMHTAIAAGIACELNRVKDRLNCNILVLFQPAEEANPVGGARPVTEAGFLTDQHIDEMYGLHMWPSLPVGDIELCGYTPEQLREYYHYPEKHFGQPHFLACYTDGPALLAVNKLRTVVRQTELAAYAAFRDADGNVTRGDMILGLNRLSSLMWIFMIKLKAGRYERK